MKDHKKRGLARGLDALLSDAGQEVLNEPQVEVLKYLDITRIRPGM